MEQIAHDPMEQIVVRMKNGTFWNRTKKHVTTRTQINELKASGVSILEYDVDAAPAPIRANPRKSMKRVPCEICGERICSSDDTVCSRCDKEILAVFDAVPASETPPRRCRLCGRPLGNSRYFSCDVCIPYLEGEDGLMDIVQTPIENAFGRYRSKLEVRRKF